MRRNDTQIFITSFLAFSLFHCLVHNTGGYLSPSLQSIRLNLFFFVCVCVIRIHLTKSELESVHKTFTRNNNNRLSCPFRLTKKNSFPLTMNSLSPIIPILSPRFNSRRLPTVLLNRCTNSAAPFFFLTPHSSSCGSSLPLHSLIPSITSAV